eukprot:15463608-Alexandrium_andersonii.AAC.1
MPPAPGDDGHLALQDFGGSQDGDPVDPAAVAVDPLLVLFPGGRGGLASLQGLHVPLAVRNGGKEVLELRVRKNVLAAA